MRKIGDTLPKDIYFFQRRDKETGQVIDGEFVDCDERDAWNLYRNPRKFYYVGRSDGAILREVYASIEPLKKNERGFYDDVSDEVKEKIREATTQEIEVAGKNRVAPRNYDRIGLDGKPAEGDLKRAMSGTI